MTQSLTIKIKGAYTYPSDLSEVPVGALAVAENIWVDRDSIAEPRRGFGYLTHGAGVQSTFSDADFRARKYFYYQNKTLAAYSTNLMAYHDTTTGWVPYTGSYEVPDSTNPVRSAKSNQNFYFTTADGVKKIDAFDATPATAGVSQALDLQVSGAVNVTPTATTDATNVLNTVSSISGVAIGMSVTGTNVPANSYITSFNGTTITLSNATTGSGSGITMTIAPTATWLAAGDGDNTTAYRLLWVITDANQNLIQSSPSQISEYVNTTAGIVSTIVNFSIPTGITTSHKYQLYRSPAVASGVSPNDEGQLVYEGTVIAADITYGTISVLDIVPDALFGATIYTAQSQQGLAQQNSTLPLARDLELFKNTMFYANTSNLQSYDLTLLGTGSPAGIQADDTITIDSVVFTAKATETITSGQFEVPSVVLLNVTGDTTDTSTSVTNISSMTDVAIGQSVSGTGIPSGTYITALPGGTTITISQAATVTDTTVAIVITGASAAQAIRDAALSLVRVINRYASSTTYAYYMSSVNDLPGKIYITGRTVGQSAFTVISSRSTCWSPALPASGSTEISNNQTNISYIYPSKDQQPEHVSLANYLPVGNADAAILRIKSLRDALFILKEDGIFYVTGTDISNFQVFPLDYTTILISPESVSALNNQIYAYTTQGVVAITQNGVAIMSKAIKEDLTDLISINYSVLQTATFGVAYESSRAYYLFLPTAAADTDCTQYWRYNYITESWTHSTMSKTCGGINPLDDKLYLGNSTSAITDVENKNLTFTDYADYQSTETISAVSGTLVTISSSDTIAIGSIIFQSVSIFGIVASVNTIDGTVTTTLDSGLATGAADVLAPIATEIKWVPISFDNPGLTKQFREVTPLFKSDFNGTGTLTYSSDIYPQESTESVSGGNVGGWGLFGWGGQEDTPSGVPWGGDPRRRGVRSSVPRNQQRCTLLNFSFKHAYGYSPWELQGISVIGNIVSERSSN